VLCYVSGIILFIVSDLHSDGVYGLGDIILLAIAFSLYPTFGALIVSRRPANLIGWIFCAIGVGTSLTFVGPLYADYVLLDEPGALPSRRACSWSTSRSSSRSAPRCAT
jgi:hypothetical protein